MNNTLHMPGAEKTSARHKFQLGMILVTIGIVYGDIGTSPMYVMKSILEGNGSIGQTDEAFIIGSLSLVIWTITLLTTIKYVLIAMKADNHGEGGIFSLYSLVKNCGKWLIVPAMLGGAALLADGVLTPAVTVTTAVEGLRSIPAMDHLLGGRTGQGGLHYPGDHCLSLLRPARRHQQDRQGLWPGDADLVLLPGRRRPAAYSQHALCAAGL